MAYKSKTVTVNNWSSLNEELRDFLVNDVGWVDETPSGQDDEMGAGDFHGILGHFLRSSGEDGNQDVCLHLNAIQQSTQSATSPIYQQPYLPAFSYLSSGIDDTQTSIGVDDDTLLAGVNTPFVARIGDELVSVSSVSGGSLAVTRGAYGSTPTSHSSGDVVLNTSFVQSRIDVYAYRDLSTSLLASSGSASIGKGAVTALPGLSGYGDDRFNSHAFLKITDGAEAGKMRPIIDYVSAGGDFTFYPFLNAPGTANAELVSMGFLPTCSKNNGIGSSYYIMPRVAAANAGTDTVCWFYASKDSVWVVTKFDAGYDFFFAGNIIPYAARDTTVTTSTATAGTNTIAVANRHLFLALEKYRIISQDADDWAVNEDRPLTEPDLDPEEIPTEEFVVQSIAAGTGDAGTLTLVSNLQYTYAVGAVIGEDPRPAVTHLADYNKISPDTARGIIQGTDCWLPVYMPCDKAAIASHASHRQTSRAVHNSGDPETPYPSYLSTRGRGEANPQMGVYGAQNVGLNDPNFFSFLNDRPTMGLITLANAEASVTAYGVFQNVKGALPQCWWVELDTADARPYAAADEDTYQARWGATYEEFRVFEQRGDATDTAIFGPEIA